MIEVTPQLPFPASPNRPAVKALVSGGEVIGSGTIVAKNNQEISFQVFDLQFYFIFDDNANEIKVDFEQIQNKSMRITFRNFNNPLGTAIDSINIANVHERILWLSVYVEAISNVKAVSYTFIWGGDLDRSNKSPK
jgi:hypothetical protein